jgi:hypothetical protein
MVLQQFSKWFLQIFLDFFPEESFPEMRIVTGDGLVSVNNVPSGKKATWIPPQKALTGSLPLPQYDPGTIRALVNAG